MKKLLLLGALVISANTFSAASIVGGGLNINAGTAITGGLLCQKKIQKNSKNYVIYV